MTLRLNEWRGALPRAVLLAVAVALIPLPAAAAERRPSPKPGTIKASVDKISVRDFAPAAVAKAKAARAERQASGGGRDASFFKTKPGVLVLVVMIAGTGYALYSAQHDRITSPAKK